MPANLVGMRIALLIATSALVAGCSSDVGGNAESASALTTPSMARTTAATTPKRPPTSTGAPVAPAAGAAIGDVVAWIAAGTPADPGAFGSMTRDGVSTPLGGQVAFVTSGTEANCVTNEYRDGALACLVKLTDPPPRPPGIETAWKNNWVDFDGTSVDVGSPHGDPGPFINGVGAELPAGQTLAFGDYRCRADGTGLYCVNYAHQTAVKVSSGGVEGFGCLQKATPPADIGLRFSC